MADTEDPYAQFNPQPAPAPSGEADPYAQFNPKPAPEHWGTWGNFFKALPGAMLEGFAGSAGEMARNEMTLASPTPESLEQAAAIPSGEEGRRLVEEQVTGKLPNPEGTFGRYGHAVGTMIGADPFASVVGAATAPVATALAPITSEYFGNLAKGTKAEIPARILGSLVGPAAATVPGLLTKAARATAAEKAAAAAAEAAGRPSPPGGPGGPAGPPSEPPRVSRPGGDPNVRTLPPTVPHDYRPMPSEAGAARARTFIDSMKPESISKAVEMVGEEAWTPGSLDARLENMSPLQMAAEVSPNMEGHAAGIAAQPGAARNEITGAVMQRHGEQVERIDNAANVSYGETQNQEAWDRFMRGSRAAQSNPFWQQFDRLVIPPTPELERVLSRPGAVKALKEANVSLANRGLPTENTFFIPGEDAPETVRMPTARAFQILSKSFDDIVGEAIRSGRNAKASEYLTLKNDVLDAVYNHPDPTIGEVWRAAKQSWAEPSALLDARKFGYELLSNKIHETEVPYTVAGIRENASQMDAARIGVRQYMSDLARGKVNPGLSFINKMLTPANEAKLRAFDPEAAESFISAMQYEQEMHNAPTRILGTAATGSSAPARSAFRDRWSGAMEPEGPTLTQRLGKAVDWVTSPLKTAAKTAVGAASDRMEAAALSAKEQKWQGIRDDLSRLMTLTGGERDDAMRELLRRAIERRAGPDLTATPPAAGAAPLERTVLKRAPTGRAMQTAPLRMGREGQVLGAGWQRTLEARPDLAEKWGVTPPTPEETAPAAIGEARGAQGQETAEAGARGRPGEAGYEPQGPGRTANAPQGAYTSRSEPNDRGLVRQNFRPVGDAAQKLRDDGAATPVWQELNSNELGAKQFHNAISVAKAANPHGSAVTVYPQEDYQGARLFTTRDRKAGFAIKGDDIISVFKHPDSNQPKITRSMLDLATQQGGKRLNVFDTVLPHLYSNSGFRAVARIPWNEEYAPPGWVHDNFAKHNGGKPDVVFMVHDPANARPYEPGDGIQARDYDHGLQLQQEALTASEQSALTAPKQYEGLQMSARAPEGEPEGGGAGAAYPQYSGQRLRDLTVNDILHPDTEAVPPRSRNNLEIARQLESRGSDALRRLGINSGKITESAPHTDELLSRAMASEAKEAMGRDTTVGTDWYTGKVREAMKVATTMHPELATDVNSQTAYTLAMAITSQGEKVPSNIRLTELAYSKFAKTGKFPTDLNVADPAINGNFAQANKLIKAWGMDKFRDFLHSDFTVSDLENNFKDLGLKVGGENKGTQVKGSSIFGSKIGQGFFQNLNGNYDPVTMDLWYMRMWGRLTGTLVGKDPEVQALQRQRFTDALKESGQAVPRTPEKLRALAEQLVDTHEKDFVKNRALYDSGERTKSKVTNTATRYIAGQDGLNETPTSGSQRNWMRGVTARARAVLAEQGVNVTNADLQAILWYPEKNLYAKLGGRASEGLNVDYSQALQNHALKNGVSRDQIDAALRSVERGPGPEGRNPNPERPTGTPNTAASEAAPTAANEGSPASELPGAEALNFWRQPLQREAIRRTPSGRAMQTAPLPIGRENAILEAGMQRAAAPPLYSAVAKAIDASKTAKASPQQWMNTLRNSPGIKPEEMEWLGLNDWLKDQKGPVTKQQVADYVKANQIEVKEVERGKSYASPATKFFQYTLPGADPESYRELLLTKPAPLMSEEDVAKNIFENFGRRGGGQRWEQLAPDTRQEYIDRARQQGPMRDLDNAYTSSHWDEPNILAHVRYNDRTIDGKKALFLEEVQSDWHQQGREKGYQDPNAPDVPALANKVRDANEKVEQAIRDVWERHTDGAAASLDEARRSSNSATQDQIHAAQREIVESPEIDRLTKAHTDAMSVYQEAWRTRKIGAVPDAPFKTTWPELAMKRIIRHAAENGYDKVAWTPGDVQAARYDLSKQVDRLTYDPERRRLRAYKDGQVVIRKDAKPNELDTIVGKAVADKLLNTEVKPDAAFKGASVPKVHSLEGLDLKVGGEGMKGFYDQMLPAAVNKLVKKYGAKVGYGEIEKPPARAAEFYRISRNDDGDFIISNRETRDIVGRPFPSHREAASEVGRLNNKRATEKTFAHSLDLTPSLKRAAILQGFPMFAGGGAVKDKRRDRSAFLYMEPHGKVPDFAQCGSCARFIPKTQRCYWFGRDDVVKAEDSCGLYVQGDPLKGTPRPIAKVAPKEAGFYKGETRCENCDAFDGKSKCGLFAWLNKESPEKWNLDEKVKPRGCCNAFHPVAKRQEGGVVGDDEPATPDSPGDYLSPVATVDPWRAYKAAAEHQQRWPSPPVSEQIPDIIGKTGSMAANAIMAPVNVAKRYTEGVLTDPYNDEQNARNAADTALTLAGAGAPAAEEGALGIFAGMGAKTANRPKLALAMDMEKEGAHPEAVWQKTGWFRGVDDKWRFEIPDYASQIYRAKPGQPDTTLVEHQLSHPELFEAYPDLAHRMLNDIPRDPISGIPSGHGGFRPSTGQLYLDKDVTTTPFSERRGVLLHELQHAVQQKEGFAPGSSTKHPEVQAEAGRVFQERQRDARNTQNDLLALQTKYVDDQIKAGRNMTRVDLSREFWDKNPDLKDKWTNTVDAMIPNRNLDLFNAYKRVAGEVEARNVADRAYHPPSTLTAPWTTEDTPRGMQILPGRGGFPTGRASGGRVMSHYIDKNPSEAQKRYGNYKKAHVNIHGLDISIENAKGQLRKGVGKDGKPWSVSMPAHYGYIKRTEGADGDHVDCYVGPHTSSRKVFVVDQKDADTGKFDEHKCLLGFGSQKQAADLYLKGFSDGRGSARLGHMTEMDIDQFRHWLKRDDTTEPIKGTHHAPKIDTSHDVRWISEMSKDGTIFYRDRSLPEQIINNKKWLKIDEPLLRHEVAEYAAIKRMTAEFERKNGRKPDDKEREEIYKTSHYNFGEVAEHEYLKEHGFDVGSWEAWCRGKLSHLENKKQVKPPPNPHVRPMPHDRRELESAV